MVGVCLVGFFLLGFFKVAEPAAILKENGWKALASLARTDHWRAGGLKPCPRAMRRPASVRQDCRRRKVG